MTVRAVSVAVLWVGALVALAPARALAQSDERAEVERLERQIADARKQLVVVRELVERGELTALERARQRFAEAETQFLLENYEGAAALLPEVVDTPAFRADSVYPRALFYLAESYFQIKSYLEARRYFREAVSRLPPGRQHQDSIVRLIDLSDRTGDFQGIDEFYEAARASGSVRPEVTYLFAKWTARRRDLPFQVRADRALQDFARVRSGGPYYAQATYFRGALLVQLGRLDEAAALFEEVTRLPDDPRDPRMGRVREIASLALARVRYEQGRTEEAIALYRSVSVSSPDYAEALFELAATYVKMGRHEEALRTADVLLVVGRDSPVAPHAKVLQANLLLRMGQYDRASATFDAIVQTYSPVRDEIRAVLDQPDPVATFDAQLSRDDQSLDITQLLPQAARGFVDAQRDVTEARQIGAEMTLSKQTVDESQKLAQSLLDRLASGRHLFPQIQEAHSRAVQESNALAALERKLGALQVRLLGEDLPESVRAELDRLEVERKELDALFAKLPRSQDEFDARRERFMRRITQLERASFDLRRQLEAMRAQVDGLRYYWDTTRDTRRPNPALDAEQKAAFEQYLTLIEQLDEQRRAVDQQLADDRSSVVALVAGGQLEDDLRARYRQQLEQMRRLIQGVLPTVSEERQALLVRAGEARTEVDSLQNELSGLRARLREKAVQRADDYRQRLIAEQAMLDDYRAQLRDVEQQTRQILGRIAYEAFRRVGQQFDDIVIQADVGLVDVAWTRKKERTDAISDLARAKERELRLLQERYSEVLSDVD